MDWTRRRTLFSRCCAEGTFRPTSAVASKAVAKQNRDGIVLPSDCCADAVADDEGEEFEEEDEEEDEDEEDEETAEEDEDEEGPGAAAEDEETGPEAEAA